MCAAELTIWSIASSEKLIVMSSTTGRSPTMAAPTPAPTIVFSEIGVSRTRIVLVPPLALARSSSVVATRSVLSADIGALALDDGLELLAPRAVLGLVALALAAVDTRGALVDRVPATDLVAEHVDVVVEGRGLGMGRPVGERDGLVDDRDGLLVDVLHVVLGHHALVAEAGGEGLERIALAPLLDLLLGAVLLRVGHRVAAEAVGDRHDEDGPAVLARAAECLRRDLVGVDDVHPVAAHPRHAEAVAALVQVGDGRVPLERRPHAELVVRDHEDDRQPPERGEVERLAERALVGSAVAELAEDRVLGLHVVGAEREAGRDREVAADDPVAAHEAALEVEHVHRAAAALGAAVDPAEELGHHVVGVRAAHDRVAVGAVR